MDLGFRGWVPAERPRFVKALDVLGLPIASDMGLFLEPRPKPMMKRVFALGLPMKTLGSDLSCIPDPVRVGEWPHANPSQIPCFNLLLQIIA